MRVALRRYRQVGFAAAMAVMAPGCVNFVDIETVDRQRIEHAHTWTFLQDDPPLEVAGRTYADEAGYRVTAVLRDRRALDREVAAAVERVLAARGYLRVDQGAQLYVNYHLHLEPRFDSREVGFAAKTLSSLSYSSSYIVEGGNIETRIIEAFELEVEIHDAQGGVLWQGKLDRTAKPEPNVAIQSSVERLFVGFPERLPD